MRANFCDNWWPREHQQIEGQNIHTSYSRTSVFLSGYLGCKESKGHITMFHYWQCLNISTSSYKDGAAKITQDLRQHGLLPESVEFLSPSQAGGFSGHQGKVCSVANQMNEKAGVMPTLVVVAFELGSRGNQGTVSSVAKQMNEKTGVMPTLAAAASEWGSRGNQGAVSSIAKQKKEKTGVMPTMAAAASKFGSRGNQQGAVSSIANQMELETGVMPTAASAASRLGRYAGGKGVRKPKGNAVWAKVVQISWSNKEMLGTEKSGNTIGKIAFF